MSDALNSAIRQVRFALDENKRLIHKGSHFFPVSREAIKEVIAAAEDGARLKKEIEMLRECNAQLVASEQSIRNECNRLRALKQPSTIKQ